MDYKEVPTVTLDALRVRLSQLVHSLQKLSQAVQSPLLPDWPSLHQQFNVVLLQLESVVNSVEASADQTQKSVVYPVTNFFKETVDGLLTTLLRKKNLPNVEEWIAEAQEKLSTLGLDPKSDDDFSSWAYEYAEENTQVKVLPVKLANNGGPSGWPLDDVIKFMTGNK